MKKLLPFCCLFLSLSLFSQELPTRWDELTASDWPQALEKSNRTIILPMAVMEKHGPHLPIGADVIRAREYADRATQEEYAVIFPDYFYGQVNEAKHIQGTFSLPVDLTLQLLEATCEEIARNGFNKIMIINGHGGNPQLIRYFVQTQMEKKRDYAVYFFTPGGDAEYQKKLSALRKSDPQGDNHAGERETSELLYLTPQLVQMDKATSESGANQQRLPEIPNVYTGIWWYAAYPGHYAGEGATGSKEVGELVVEHQVDQIATALKAIKADTKTLELQNKFYADMEESSSK